MTQLLCLEPGRSLEIVARAVLTMVISALVRKRASPSLGAKIYYIMFALALILHSYPLESVHTHPNPERKTQYPVKYGICSSAGTALGT